MDEENKVEPTLGQQPAPSETNQAADSPTGGSTQENDGAGAASALTPVETEPVKETVVERVEDVLNTIITAVAPVYRMHHPLHGDGGIKEIYRFSGAPEPRVYCEGDGGAELLIYNGVFALTPVEFPLSDVTTYVSTGPTETYYTRLDADTRLRALQALA